MVDDTWVIEVLQDIGKFAETKGFSRLQKSLNQASEEFLDDLREQHLGRIARKKQKREEAAVDEVILKFPNKSSQ